MLLSLSGYIPTEMPFGFQGACKQNNYEFNGTKTGSKTAERVDHM